MSEHINIDIVVKHMRLTEFEIYLYINEIRLKKEQLNGKKKVKLLHYNVIIDKQPIKMYVKWQKEEKN